LQAQQQSGERDHAAEEAKGSVAVPGMGGFGREMRLNFQRDAREVGKAGDAERENETHCTGDEEAWWE